MTLGEKVEHLASQFQEIAFGYNDSGCFWTIHYGNRGTGSMLEICEAGRFSSEPGTFEEAVDEFIKEFDRMSAEAAIGRRGGV